MSTLPAKLQQWKEELHTQPCKKLAYDIIQDYFNHYAARELEQEFWLLFTAALTHPDSDKADSPIDRQNRFFFFEFHKLMIDAVQVVLRETGSFSKDP